MDFEVAWFRKLFLLSSMIHGFIIRKLVGLRATFTLLSRCFFQKQLPEVFLEISQNSQENTCASVSLFLNKVGGLSPSLFQIPAQWYYVAVRGNPFKFSKDQLKEVFQISSLDLLSLKRGGNLLEHIKWMSRLIK